MSSTPQFTDIVTMFLNAGSSMVSVIELFAGICYVAGFVFILIAFGHLRKIADRHAMYPSHEKGFVPLVYMVIGAALIFLPETIKILSNSLFHQNILSGGRIHDPKDILHAVSLLCKIVGIIWVLRGCALLAGSTNSGEKHGSKGLAFLAAGIMLLNLESTISAVNTIVNKIVHMFDTNPLS